MNYIRPTSKLILILHLSGVRRLIAGQLLVNIIEYAQNAKLKYASPVDDQITKV